MPTLKLFISPEARVPHTRRVTEARMSSSRPVAYAAIALLTASAAMSAQAAGFARPQTLVYITAIASEDSQPLARDVGQAIHALVRLELLNRPAFTVREEGVTGCLAGGADSSSTGKALQPDFYSVRGGTRVGPDQS